MIAIQNHTTAMADVRTNAQGFLNDGATCATFLTGIVRWHCNHGDVMQGAVAVKPL